MKKRFCIAVLVIAVMLTGCSNGPNLSRVHRNMEAEYMAGLLLKYDADYDGMLEYDRSILNPTPTPEPTRKPATPSSSATGSAASSNKGPGGGADDSQVKSYMSLEEMGTVQGITLSQESYELKGSYGSSFAVVNPEQGNRLLVVKFRLKNGNSKMKKVNMSKEDLSFSLEIGGQNVGAPEKTMLPNDLQFYRSKIAAGKSQEAVLIFEISKSQKVEDANLYISAGSKNAQVSLK